MVTQRRMNWLGSEAVFSQSLICHWRLSLSLSYIQHRRKQKERRRNKSSSSWRLAPGSWADPLHTHIHIHIVMKHTPSNSMTLFSLVWQESNLVFC
ncbi:hypothetical protein ACFX2J_028389 [Malus domestica]